MSGSGRAALPVRLLVVAARVGMVVAVSIALWAAPALADVAADVDGVLRDGQGRLWAGADVVVTDAWGRDRSATVTDEAGRFRVRRASGGVCRILVIDPRGTEARALVLDVTAGRRVRVDIDFSRASTRVHTAPPVDELPRLSARDPDLPPMAATDDLAGFLAAVPGAMGPAPPADGPVIAGSDPAQTILRLEGFRLDDPIDGRAPWELPVDLFGAVVPRLGLGPAGQDDPGGATVDLAARRAERSSGARVAFAATGVAPAGEADGRWRPRGTGDGGSFAGRAERVLAEGRLRFTLAIAPERRPWQIDPAAVTAARARRPTEVLPAVARADGELGSWRFMLLGLGSHTHWMYGRNGPLLDGRDPQTLTRDLALLGGEARRSLGPGLELVLRGSVLGAWRRTTPVAGDPLRTTAERSGLSAVMDARGAWLGRHDFRVTAGIDVARGHSHGNEPSHQAGLPVGPGHAARDVPSLALDERYLPIDGLELEAGLRVEKGFFSGHSLLAGAPLDRSFVTDLLLAPRAQVTWRLDDEGSRLFASAGRYGVITPLAPVLGGAAGPPGELPPAVEQVARVGAELCRAGLCLDTSALERRTVDAVEDRFSPITGRLELFSPRDLQRRYRALAAQAVLSRPSLRTGLAVTRSWLVGDHVGFVDPGTGQLAPAGTAEGDTDAGQINRRGPLPFERSWSARGFVEHGGWLSPRWRLAGGVAGRLDSGVPLSALARSVESGPGETYLVQRGSLGRTGAVGSLDAAVSLAGVLGGTRGSLALEGSNLTNHRPVIARDQIYTDTAAPPLPGARGRAPLANTGAPPSPTFLNPVAWAEPLSLRLVLTLEL